MRFSHVLMGALIAVIVLATIIVATTPDTPEAGRPAKVKVAELQNTANHVIGGIQYMKDPRTNPPICYAYYHSGAYGGPALATVPCENIPANMLTTPEWK